MLFFLNFFAQKLVLTPLNNELVSKFEPFHAIRKYFRPKIQNVPLALEINTKICSTIALKPMKADQN